MAPRSGSKWLAMLIVLAAVFGVGCGGHLAGTHDVTLRYRIVQSAISGDAAVTAVKRRLGAAHVAADVRLASEVPDDAAAKAAGADRTLVILTDDDEVASVKTLVQWRGGVMLLRPDASAGDPLYEGATAAATAKLHEVKLDADHLAVLERASDTTARVRIVLAKPVLDATEGIATVTQEGGNWIDLEANDAVKTEFAPLSLDVLSQKFLIVRGRTVLPAPMSAPSSPLSRAFAVDHLYVMFPHTLPGYAHAHAMADVLKTPLLPELESIDEAPAPVDHALAAGCLVVPFVLSALWLLFVRRFDRAEPEPAWLVGATFLLGCLSCVPAGLAEVGLTMATPWLNPTYATLGGQMIAVPFALIVFSLTVGVSEEGSKFLGTWSLARHRKEFDEPVDGIIYAAASALGFAAVENVKYFAIGRLSAALIVARTFMSIPAHLLFAAIWGYGLGRRVAFPRARVWPWFVLAAVLHGAFDTFLSFGSLGILSIVLEGSLAMVFIVLLRRALRYGPADPTLGDTPDESQRTSFTVGSSARFAASAVAFVTSMIPLAVLAGLLETRHPRHVLPWLLGGSALVVLSGLAAYAVSATMPLDVVLDAHGITFAGARRAWASVRGLRAIRGQTHYARLASSDGDLSIGPTDPDTLARLHEAIGERATNAVN